MFSVSKGSSVATVAAQQAAQVVLATGALSVHSITIGAKFCMILIFKVPLR